MLSAAIQFDQFKTIELLLQPNFDWKKVKPAYMKAIEKELNRKIIEFGYYNNPKKEDPTLYRFFQKIAVLLFESDIPIKGETRVELTRLFSSEYAEIQQKKLKQALPESTFHKSTARL